MNHLILIAVYVIAFVLVFLAFGMQRMTLILSREYKVPIEATRMLLPWWFPLVWLLRITKWAILAIIFFSWSWMVAAGLIILDFILTAALPIPSTLYSSTFMKQVEHVKTLHLGAGNFLQKVISGQINNEQQETEEPPKENRRICLTMALRQKAEQEEREKQEEKKMEDYLFALSNRTGRGVEELRKARKRLEELTALTPGATIADDWYKTETIYSDGIKVTEDEDGSTVTVNIFPQTQNTDDEHNT